jgi:hypothetical protein
MRPGRTRCGIAPSGTGILGTMKLTVFWERMRAHFGEAYAASFAQDHVMSQLDGRTVDQAMADGWETKDIWRAVCEAVDVPASRR